MSTRRSDPADEAVLEGAADCVAHLESGGKPPSRWRLGTEHEKLVFDRVSLDAPAHGGQRGIEALLLGFAAHGWSPVEEDGRVIAMEGPDGGISLEPAGQFELSGALRTHVHETCQEMHRHIAQCLDVGGRLGLGFAGIGFNPRQRRDELPVMPKPRYAIMRRWMPQVGQLGLDMMLRTCTTQVNLDFADEADMVRKLRVGLALQPVATALFANSPFREGRPSDFRSLRAHVWTDTDAARTGMLPWAFEDGMGFERYAHWALDVPMYFVWRRGRYIDCAGESFRAFLEGRLPQLPGQRPTLADWKDHLSTLFPEVRLKTFLEMRGADGGPAAHVCALPAFWAGLLYDPVALDEAWQLCRGWTAAERETLRRDAARAALAAPAPGGRTMRKLAADVLAIARRGLESRGFRAEPTGPTEARFLDPLDRMVAEGRTLADRLVQLWEGPWAARVDPAYRLLDFASPEALDEAA